MSRNQRRLFDVSLFGNIPRHQNGIQRMSVDEEDDYDQLNIREPSKFEKHHSFLMRKLRSEYERLTKPGGLVPTTRLFAYQIEAIFRVVEYFNENSDGNALVVAPPGSGKSGLAVLLPTALKSKKVLILTPSNIISTQLQIAFGGRGNRSRSFVCKVGLIEADRTTQLKNFLETPLVPENGISLQLGVEDTNLVIVNVQKFGGRARLSLSSSNPNLHEAKSLFEEFDTVIVDEAHHIPADTWRNIIDEFAEKRVILLTATPYRGSIDNEIKLTDISPNIREVYRIDKSQLEGIAIRKCLFKERTMIFEEFSTEYFRLVKRHIEEELAEHYRQERRLERRQQVLILARTIEDCKKIASGLKKLGLKSTHITSETDGTVQDSFSRGEYQVGVICRMWLEGYDNSNITLCVILTRVQSRSKFEQFIGRCCRTDRDLTLKGPDSTNAMVLSYDIYEQQQLWDKMKRDGFLDTEFEEDELVEYDGD